MTTIQNIHQFSSATLRPTQIWSDSLCGDVILGFAAYNNQEPKQGKTGV
jgi:hypothetical protein